jgi:hypothetical protein
MPKGKRQCDQCGKWFPKATGRGVPRHDPPVTWDSTGWWFACSKPCYALLKEREETLRALAALGAEPEGTREAA